MRVLTLVTLGAIVAAHAAAPVAGAQQPEPRPPRAPRPPAAPPAPVAFRFSMADDQPDRATLGVLLGDAGVDGVRVVEVASDGPAARAGIAAGDRIVAVGDVRLRLDAGDAADPLLRMIPERRLRIALDDANAGDAVTLRVVRDGAERTVRVTTVRADALATEPIGRRIAPMPAMPAMPSVPRMESRAVPRPPAPPRPPTSSRLTVPGFAPPLHADRASIGVTLANTGSPRDTLGVFVAAVVPDGPAERAGIHEGMRIVAIDDVSVRGGVAGDAARRRDDDHVARLERELAKLEPGDEVTLRVRHDGAVRELRVRTARAADVYRDGRAPGGMRIEMRSPGALSDDERVRIETRMHEARERMDEARERMVDARQRAVVRSNARAIERRGLEAATSMLRAMPTTMWSRRWMD